TLDGGGIRGYSELLMLEAIMERIKEQKGMETTPLPCSYFDVIGGTSTGGIIALMLGPLKMSVADALKVYENLGKAVF
ncbi:FabD/lysophospholipase-like protein, partial [Sistotremastrum suecicum HHB10207 ss-3]